MAEIADPLRAGPIRAALLGTTLRNISFDRSEIVRAVAPTIRTGTWDTVEPRLVSRHVGAARGGFLVLLVLEARSPELALDYTITYEAAGDGALTCCIEGTAHEDSRVSRWGFCLLHGMAMAGRTVRVRIDDRVESHELPVVISPERPVSGFSSIDYVTADGFAVATDLGGARYQLEDQRNWGDATYKAFTPPLTDPHPMTIGRGERFSQVVTIHATAARGRSRSGIEDMAVPSVGVGHSLPAIGTSIRSDDLPWNAGTVAALQEIGLDHLQVDVDARDERWSEDLAKAAAAAEQLSVPLILHVVSPGLEEGDLRLIASHREVVKAVGAFDPVLHTTTARLLSRLDRLAALAGVERLVGSRAHAVQLLRSWPPVRGDALTLGFTPGAHYADRQTLVENLEGIDHIVRQIQGAQGMPIVLGPITLGPRFNDAATVTVPNPPDQRQAEAFGAAWALGMVMVGARQGVQSLTLFEATGPGGLVSSPPGLSPAARLIRKLSSDSVSIGAIAVWTRSGVSRLQVGDGVAEMIANLSDQTVEVPGHCRVRGPAGDIVCGGRLDPNEIGVCE